MPRPDATAGPARARHARRPRGEGGRAGPRDRCGTRRRRRPPARRTPAPRRRRRSRGRAGSCGAGQALLGPRGAAGKRRLGDAERQVRQRQLEDRHPAAGRLVNDEAATVRRGDRGDHSKAVAAARVAPAPPSRRSDAPGAVLETEMRTPRGPIVASTQTRRPPCSIALASRLSSACATRHGSAIAIAAPARQRSSSERRACAARPRQRSTASSTSARQATGRRARGRAEPLISRSRSSSAASASSAAAGTGALRDDAGARASACSGRRSSCRLRLSAARRRASRTRSPTTAAANVRPSGQPATPSSASALICSSPPRPFNHRSGGSPRPRR